MRTSRRMPRRSSTQAGSSGLLGSSAVRERVAVRSSRIEESTLELLLEGRSGDALDDHAEQEVVRVRVRPALSRLVPRRMERREHLLPWSTRARGAPRGRVASVSLKTSARPLVWSRSWRIVICRLTWRRSGRNRRDGVVEAQPALVDELEDRGGNEGLRDAADDHRALGRQPAAPVALDAAAAGPHDLAVAHDGERRAIGAGTDAGRIQRRLELRRASSRPRLAAPTEELSAAPPGRDGGTSDSTAGATPTIGETGWLVRVAAPASAPAGSSAWVGACVSSGERLTITARPVAAAIARRPPRAGGRERSPWPTPLGPDAGFASCCASSPIQRRITTDFRHPRGCRSRAILLALLTNDDHRAAAPPPRRGPHHGTTDAPPRRGGVSALMPREPASVAGWPRCATRTIGATGSARSAA